MYLLDRPCLWESRQCQESSFSLFLLWFVRSLFKLTSPISVENVKPGDLKTQQSLRNWSKSPKISLKCETKGNGDIKSENKSSSEQETSPEEVSSNMKRVERIEEVNAEARKCRLNPKEKGTRFDQVLLPANIQFFSLYGCWIAFNSSFQSFLKHMSFQIIYYSVKQKGFSINKVTKYFLLHNVEN